MITKRIIPCLDVRDGRVVKGVNFEGLNDVSSPVELGRYYSENGADERRGKAANRAYEEAFVSNVTFHGVALGRVLVDGDSSAYEMTLEFTPKGGGRVVQRQVAVQSWRDGKIVRETFYHA